MASSITKHCDKRHTLEREELGAWGKELEKVRQLNNLILAFLGIFT